MNSSSNGLGANGARSTGDSRPGDDLPVDYRLTDEEESRVDRRLRKVAESRERVHTVRRNARFKLGPNTDDYAFAICGVVKEYLTELEWVLQEHAPEVWNDQEIASMEVSRPSEVEVVREHLANASGITRSSGFYDTEAQELAKDFEFDEVSGTHLTFNGLCSLLEVPEQMTVSVSGKLSRRHGADEKIEREVTRQIPARVSEAFFRRANVACGDIGLDLTLEDDGGEEAEFDYSDLFE